jgi:hypothetical protein
MTIQNSWSAEQSSFAFQPHNPKLTVDVLHSGEMLDALSAGVSLDCFFSRFSEPEEPLHYYINHAASYDVLCGDFHVRFNHNAEVPECLGLCGRVQYWCDLDFDIHDISWSCCRGRLYDVYGELIEFSYFYNSGFDRPRIKSWAPWLNDGCGIICLNKANNYVLRTANKEN